MTIEPRRDSLGNYENWPGTGRTGEAELELWAVPRAAEAACLHMNPNSRWEEAPETVTAAYIAMAERALEASGYPAELERVNVDLDDEARAHVVTHEWWAKAQAELQRLRNEIRKHRDTLDAQANGALPRLDRDDVDNTLYNATIGAHEGDIMSDLELPGRIGLCPSPWGHAQEFYVPHDGRCPAVGCEHDLVMYVPEAEVERLGAEWEIATKERAEYRAQAERADEEVERIRKAHRQAEAEMIAVADAFRASLESHTFFRDGLTATEAALNVQGIIDQAREALA